ncbi:hypothetical protein GCM10009727_28490 [Actinomadura napierensis]|uniref:Uncharacterized protein n=1 Tax=Actinomadura napierensis TaxID=267854 RepID=A0ABP5KMA9_9ACTN
MELSSFDWLAASRAIHTAWRPLSLIGTVATEKAFRALIAQMYANTAATTGTPVPQDGLDRMVAEMDRRLDALVEALRADLGV